MAATETLTLTDFLLARIAEDEAAVRAASPGLDFNWGDYGISPDLLADAEFFNRFADRARVLAECEAKRRIVERWEYRWGEADAAADNPNLTIPERNAMHGMFASQATGLGNALGFMAEVYADHPDYDESWRP